MNNISISRNAGFTIIELMVALVLGLIVVAAAVQLFTGGILSSRLQQANAEIQDSGIFGVDYVIRDIRFANQENLTNLKLDDRTPYGGVILTGSTATNQNANFVPKVGVTTYIDSALLSRGQGDTVSSTNNYWKGLTQVTLKNRQGSTISNPVSDQLTIQFFAPENMVNCEGANVLVGDLVVQRYFLRPDANGASTDYALACDANTPLTSTADVAAAAAARITPDATTGVITPMPITGLGDAGQIIIPRVDHFHVLIGAKTTTTIKTTNTSTTPSTITSSTSDQFAYYTIPQYRSASDSARASTVATTSGSVVTDVNVSTRILSLQISMLIRSANNAQNNAIDPSQPFFMLDNTATPSNTTTRFQRRVYSSTVALRNGMGDVL
ncbi:PilW family protein [Acinetobacter venetianus]|uniref:PilW family protein n=1 Tax=Acinetobacter venetianus TaxID=52133 RepID=UPI0028A056C0|nr:PilW family protein [Acinetobacter venetianus]